MNVDLVGHKAIVTGGASGIGRACAQHLRACGADVAIADKNLDAAQQAADEIGALALIMDVADEASVEQAAAAIEARWGGVDALVNCAGVLQRTLPPGELTLKEWDFVTRVDQAPHHTGAPAPHRPRSAASRSAARPTATRTCFLPAPMHSLKETIMKTVLARYRGAICALLAGLSLALAGNAAWANDWPTKPITVFVPYGAGGPVDTVTRMVTEIAAKALNQPIVVENKPGANTMLSTAALARSAPDGYTFGVIPAAYTTNQILVKDLSYKPTDLKAVSHMVDIPLFLFASPSAPATNLAEFVVWARQKQPSYASTGVGSTGHLLGEMFSQEAGLKGVHVPYTGSAKAMPDLMAGRVDYFFDPASGGMPHVRNGKLKVFAISAPQRCECAPDLPTMAESGFPGIVQGSWIGLMAPAGTPAAAVDRMSQEFSRALKSPELAARLKTMGFGVAGSTPARFQALIDRDISAYAAIVRKANIQLER